MDFIRACENNDIELAKTYPIPDQQTLKQIFLDMCRYGHLESAKWLHILNPNILDADAFIYTCFYNNFNIAKWMHTLGVDISYNDNSAFINACLNNHLELAIWLYELGVNIADQHNLALKGSCYYNNINIVKWLIDIYYKYGSYIYFENYTSCKDEIKNLLIDNNLIDPSTLSEADLAYYLARTDNFVPSDFTTPHEGFNVKYRGKHTKAAPRE